MKSASLAHTSEKIKRSWLQEAFPVPKIILPPAISIEISDGVLRYFEFARSLGKLKPKAYGSKLFPRIHIGAEDEKLRQEAAKALGAWAAETGHRSVHAVIHEDDAYAFKITVPVVGRSALREAIESVLEENVPIPPAEAVFEYEIVSEDKKLGETTVAVAVVSEKTIREYIEIFSAAGISIVAFETESRSIARALFPKDDVGAHAVLSISRHHSIAFLVDRGAVVFSSSIAVGSSDIDRAIAKTFDMTEEDARKFIDKLDGDHEESAKIFEAIIPVLSTMHDELGKILLYWKAQEKKEREFKELEDVVLVGRDAAIAGFDHYVSVTSKMPAKIGDIWKNVLSPDEELPNLHKRDSLDFAALVGSLL